MNSSDPHQVENLLKQMSLKAPSRKLDQAVETLGKESLGKESRKRGLSDSHGNVSGRFGWGAIVAAALVASVGGLLLGQTYGWYTSPRLAEPEFASELDLATESKLGQLTPVKFNTEAFGLLHGHSTQAEFASCGACHLEDKPEAFEGWFYGNEQFFQRHGGEAHRQCSDCHLMGGDPSGPKPSPHYHEKKKDPFPHGNIPMELVDCASCHLVQNETPKSKTSLEFATNGISYF